MDKISSTSLLREARSWQALWDDLRNIEVYEFKVYQTAFWNLFNALSHAASQFNEFSWLVLSPISTVLRVLAEIEFPYLKILFSGLWKLIKRHVLPPVQRALEALWAAEVAAGPKVWAMQGGFVAFVVLLILLQRWLKRSLFAQRVTQKIETAHASFVQWWRGLQARLAGRSRAAAALLPHALYWAACALVFGRLRPGLLGALARDWGGRGLVGLFLPAAATLRRLARARRRRAPTAAKGVTATAAAGAAAAGAAGAAGAAVGADPPGPEEEEALAHLLMYWVLVATGAVAHYLWMFLPKSFQAYTSDAGAQIFLLFALWMQLPFGGVALLYARVEPLVEEYVREVTPPAFTSSFGGLLGAAATLRLISDSRRRAIEAVARDSWLLAPCALFLLTPSGLTYAATVYAGAVVPAYNSIRALKSARSTTARHKKNDDMPDEELELLRAMKLRWLTYWVAYAGFWYFQVTFDAALWFVPLLYHAQLAAVVALQLPVLRGAERGFDILMKFHAAFVDEVMVKKHSSQQFLNNEEQEQGMITTKNDAISVTRNTLLLSDDEKGNQTTEADSNKKASSSSSFEKVLPPVVVKNTSAEIHDGSDAMSKQN